MPDLFAGWSPAGIAALAALVAGIILLAIYAVQRGLFHRELEGIETAGDPGSEPPVAPTTPAGRPRRSRTLGMLGAALLVAGLALGTLAAIGSWGSDDPGGGGPGAAPADCAQSWEGCPKATPNP